MAEMKTLPKWGTKGKTHPRGDMGEVSSTLMAQCSPKNARRTFTKAQTESFPKGPVNNMERENSKPMAEFNTKTIG